MKSSAAPSRSRRPIRRLLVILLVLVAIWLGASFAVAWKRTSRADPIAAEPAAPESLGIVDSLRLKTEDDEELGAWFFPGPAEKPAVILLHGNRARREAMCDIAQLLHEAGYPLLIPTMRAHGDSTGDRNDFGYSARHDVVAAVAEVERRRPGNRIVVLGQSMGAAAALFAAEELQHRVDGYILECPYESLFTAVRNRTRAELPVGLDWLAYAGLRVVAPLVLPDAPRINAAAAADRMPEGIPVLILAGGDDDRATPEEAQNIARQLGGRARVEIIPKARHVHLCDCDREKYQSLVLEFLDGIRKR